jgi:hypothetical protein
MSLMEWSMVPPVLRAPFELSPVIAKSYSPSRQEAHGNPKQRPGHVHCDKTDWSHYSNLPASVLS